MVSPASLASFWGLCLVQGAIVLLPGVARSRRIEALRSRWVLLAAPTAAVIGATFIPSVAALLASDLSLLALVSVPPLAAVGLAWAIRWPSLRLVLLVPLRPAYPRQATTAAARFFARGSAIFHDHRFGT